MSIKLGGTEMEASENDKIGRNYGAGWHVEKGGRGDRNEKGRHDY